MPTWLHDTLILCAGLVFSHLAYRRGLEEVVTPKYDGNTITKITLDKLRDEWTAACRAEIDALTAERDELRTLLALYHEERAAFIPVARAEAGQQYLGKPAPDIAAINRLGRARLALMEADPGWTEGEWR